MKIRHHSSLGLSAALLAMVAFIAPPTASAVPFEALAAPQRIADTRPNGMTADGAVQAIGPLAAGGVLQLQVAGRAGIASGSPAAVLNVTTTNAASGGFITVYPCDQQRPNAANLNYGPNQVIANAVIAKLDPSGKTCIYSSASANVIVDATGALPAGSFTPLLAPARIVDTRPNGETIDGDYAKIGKGAPGEFLEIQVTGRAGVAAGATTAVLNVTSTNADARGFFTLYPCDQQQPNAANLNYEAGQIIANSVIAKLDASGATCLYSEASSNVIVDITGTLPADSFIPLASPTRIVDTRVSGATVDGVNQAGGIRAAGSTLDLQITGRANVPATASTAVLNVTVANSAGRGFVTAHPRNSTRPNAANLNYESGQIIANTVFANIGADGRICLFNSAATNLIVDITGYLTGPAPTTGGADCPADAPPPPTPNPTPTGQAVQPGQYLVNTQLAPGRYVMENAASGCYWERQSGLSGTIDDVLANDFRGFTGRVLVDVRASDVGFEFDADCGTMTGYPGSSALASTIGAGSFAVNQHIVPGTYSATVQSGCYWERQSAFDGSFEAIIANEFVADAGPQVVTIAASDVGFYSGADCGTWTKI